MEKKSTDYCFKGCKEFHEYCNNKNYSVAGNLFDYYYYNSSNNLESSKWNCSSLNRGRVEITWQEFKQMFIDKTMTKEDKLKELEAELNKLKAEIQKEKEDKDFKVGDYIIYLGDKNQFYGNILKIVNIEPGGYHDKWISHTPDSFSGEGFGYEPFKNDIRKATPKEIEDYLVAEAKKKYPVGAMIKCLAGCGTGKVNHSQEPGYSYDRVWIYCDVLGNNLCCYDNGKWAEIVKEEEIEISDYKAKFDKKNKTVSFGCKTIKLSQLKAILEVMQLNEQFDSIFEISGRTFSCEDYVVDTTKETIQKLIDKLEE